MTKAIKGLNVHEPKGQEMNSDTKEDLQLETQSCGYAVSVGFFLFFLVPIAFNILNLLFGPKSFEFIFYIVGSALVALMFYLSTAVPKYFAGNPSVFKLLPGLLGFLIINVTYVLYQSQREGLYIIYVILSSIAFIIFSIILYISYIKDDSESGACLCCKPWVLKPKPKIVYVIKVVQQPNEPPPPYEAIQIPQTTEKG